MPTIITRTAKVSGSRAVALNPTYHNIPRPARTPPHPRTIERGAPYGFPDGGRTNAKNASQAPNTVKTKGNAAARGIMLVNPARRKTPRIMRKAPMLRGAQGTRIRYYRTEIQLVSLIVLSPDCGG